MGILRAVTEVLGGLALFLYGLHQLSGGLQTLAGERLRAILEFTTRNRVTGYVLGCLLGFLLHSSGTTVMLVSFVNAGLFNLGQAVPVVLGANVGTTLSMQAISLNLTAFSYPAIALGMGMTFHRKAEIRAGGVALFGFGLLFLGMSIMSGGVMPYREDLRPLLETLDGTTWTGMILGIALALAVTGVLQSSGATIGMCFALIQAGVFTELTQVFPIILGAHIGTCVTAFLAGIGSPPPARRVAMSHLLFNVTNVVMAIVFQGPLLRVLEAGSDSLMRQTANLHTLVMVVASLLILPFVQNLSKFAARLVPDKGKPVQSSFLTPEHMSTIATALPAVRLEMVRLTRVLLESLDHTIQHLNEPSHLLHRGILANEEVVNTIKTTMVRQLRDLSRQKDLSFEELRQIDYWIRAVVQIERIGDHLCKLHLLTMEQHEETHRIKFGKKLNRRLNRLFFETQDMLQNLQRCLQTSGEAISEAELFAKRQEILRITKKSRDLFTARMEQARLEPRVMYYYTSYLEHFERLIRHIELAGAAAAQQPEPEDIASSPKKENSGDTLETS